MKIKNIKISKLWIYKQSSETASIHYFKSSKIIKNASKNFLSKCKNIMKLYIKKLTKITCKKVVSN